MKDNVDYELENALKEMAENGKLVDFIIDLLAERDRILPDVVLNGIPLMAPVKPPISDKSCYKKCLKESIDPKKPYSECIKKCKTTSTKWAFNIIAQ